MSRRYGRNQRRAHRERISELEAQVSRLLRTGPGGWRWHPAEDGLVTIDESSVVYSSDKTSEGGRELTRREARVTVPMSDDLEDALRRTGRVNWRGLMWRATHVSLERDHYSAGGMMVEMRLEAVAPNNWTPDDMPEHRR